MVAFALGALIGDIHRFKGPGSLVKYIGLNPAFDDSGKGKWQGGIGGHGRKDLRCLLIESAHSIMRSKDPLAKWGKRLWARKGSRNLAVAAVARKLTVANFTPADLTIEQPNGWRERWGLTTKDLSDPAWRGPLVCSAPTPRRADPSGSPSPQPYPRGGVLGPVNTNH